MENRLKEWFESKINGINDLSETDVLKQIKEVLVPDGKFYKSQGEWFLQASEELILQVRINRRYCPINEVPAQILLKQTGAKKVLVVIFNSGIITYKSVEPALR